MQRLPNSYQIFNHFVVRIPQFSLEFYKKIIERKSLKEVWKNPLIQEMIFIASPVLHEELQKVYQESKNISSKNIQKLETTFLKYLIRASSRCTPFGLFAGCSVGSFDRSSEIVLKEHLSLIKSTTYDMHFISNLFSSLNQLEIIRNQACFYPNTSLFAIGNQYRYIEISLENNQRSYSIEGVSQSEYLKRIVEKAQKGTTIETLVKSIVEEDVTEEEATEFVHTLIDHQLLISELTLSVVGDNPLEVLENILNRFTAVDDVYTWIVRLKNYLKQLDQSLVSNEALYKEIEIFLQDEKMIYKKEHLFQVDSYPDLEVNTLHSSHQRKLKQTLAFFNRITPDRTVNDLENFKKAFVKRYETREMPLVKVLDVESGLGYPIDHSISNTTPFLDGIDKKEIEKRIELKLNKVEQILSNLMIQVIDNKKYILDLHESDFEGFEVNWKNLPTTMASLIEVVQLEGVERLVMHYAGGSTGANLLGRFTHGNQAIKEHVETILTKDESCEKGKLVAEIVHIPEERTGNILRRASFRNYEIPFLGKSNLPLEQQLSIQDLTLSVRNNRLILKSEKYQKEVVPRLTNAHNYRGKGLPIYHFLCDMQLEGKRSSIGFSWGKLKEMYRFLPRVTYREVIISKALWRFKNEEIQDLYTLSTPKLMQKVGKWRNYYQIPRYVQLVERDQTLLLDLENSRMIQLGLEEVKKKEYVILEEFLFTDDTLVKKGNEHFTNQVVVSFYKN